MLLMKIMRCRLGICQQEDESAFLYKVSWLTKIFNNMWQHIDNKINCNENECKIELSFQIKLRSKKLFTVEKNY